MNRTLVSLAAIACCCTWYHVARADYGVIDKGTWPASWPKELEPLRTQARTLEGPLVLNQHFAIRFTTREQFEAAWPHLLKVRNKGTPIALMRGPNFFLGDGAKAGVIVHAPPAGEPAADDVGAPDASKRSGGGLSVRSNSIELVVDGDIVDLNRIPLPADTSIVDQLFKEAKNK
jgi:hypothetical protein